jgi:tetratricopeptide (TPR) repeat protein
MLKIKPDAPMALQAYREFLYEAGFDEYQKQHFEKSNEFFAKFLKIPNIETITKKQFEHVLYLVGLNSCFLKEFDKSIEYFTKYVNISGIETSSAPWFLVANYMLGLDYNYLNQSEKSNTYLQKFIELNKDPANQQLPLAYLLIGSNNYTDLETQIKKFGKEKIDEFNKEGDSINADTKMKPKEKDAAVVKHNEKKVQVYAEINKQQCQMALDRKDIVPNLQKAIELRPDLEDAYVNLGNYYYLAGDLENGLKTYKIIKEKFPNSLNLAAYNNFIQKIEKEISAKK